MLFKVDENLHEEVAGLLRQHGHDAMTVYDQRLQGCDDEEVAAVCRREGRAIVTQDLDFGNILAFPPQEHFGIIVLRLADQSRPAVLAVMNRILPLLASDPLVGNLWTVDEVGLRVRQGSAT